MTNTKFELKKKTKQINNKYLELKASRMPSVDTRHVECFCFSLTKEKNKWQVTKLFSRVGCQIQKAKNLKCLPVLMQVSSLWQMRSSSFTAPTLSRFMSTGALHEKRNRRSIRPRSVSLARSQGVQDVTFLASEHVCKLHVWYSTPQPEQSAPPCCGGGLSQRLKRERKPPPQEAVHSLQSPQSDHWPSTGGTLLTGQGGLLGQ